MTDAAFPLPATVAQELRAVFGKLKRRLREQTGADDFTASQMAVLMRLAKSGPATASQLARAEAMRPQSMGAVITALEAAGMIAGAPDPRDGRQTLLSVTQACRDRIETRRAAHQDWLTRTIAARLSAAEQQELARAIALLERITAD